ncbi:hypothetical protein ACP4OV_017271 [Aristida adscensionis]
MTPIPKEMDGPCEDEDACVEDVYLQDASIQDASAQVEANEDASITVQSSEDVSVLVEERREQVPQKRAANMTKKKKRSKIERMMERYLDMRRLHNSKDRIRLLKLQIS